MIFNGIIRKLIPIGITSKYLKVKYELNNACLNQFEKALFIKCTVY